jgi:hypothetical protein
MLHAIGVWFIWLCVIAAVIHLTDKHLGGWGFAVLFLAPIIGFLGFVLYNFGHIKWVAAPFIGIGFFIGFIAVGLLDQWLRDRYGEFTLRRIGVWAGRCVGRVRGLCR